MTTPPYEPWAGDPRYGPAGTVGPGRPAPGEVRTDSKAVVALVLACAAWTPTVPFLGAIAALVLARMSDRDIDRSGGRLTGRGLNTASRVIAWVHLVVLALALLVFFLLLFVFGATLFGISVS